MTGYLRCDWARFHCEPSAVSVKVVRHKKSSFCCGKVQRQAQKRPGCDRLSIASMFNVPSLDFPAELALWLEPHVAGTLFRNGIECGSRSCPLKPKPGLNGPPAGFSYGEETNRGFLAVGKTIFVTWSILLRLPLSQPLGSGLDFLF